MSKDLVYVCSPLGADTAEEIKQNMQKAKEYMKLVSEKFSCRAIAPHAILPEYLDDNILCEREFGLKFGLELLKICKMVVVCGKEISVGMKKEIELAETLGMRVLYMYESETELLQRTAILAKKGQALENNGIIYVVGDKVVANKNSMYEGLIGTISEIHIGTEKDTYNETPDIYCCFQEPIMAFNKAKVRKRLSERYKGEGNFADIVLDSVVMSPDMITPVSEICNCENKKKIYILTEDTVIDENGSVSVDVFSDLSIARANMEIKLKEEFESGMLKDKKEDEDYVFEETENSYECYLASRYCEGHYLLKLEEKELNMYEEKVL